MLLQNLHKSMSKNLAAEKSLPALRVGYTVKVHLKVKEGKKERVQIFEGIIIDMKGKELSNCMITVRKVTEGVGVERIFSLLSPSIVKMEVVKKAKVRRAKLGFLRNLTGRKANLEETYV